MFVCVFVHISNHTALCLYYNVCAVDGEQDQTWKLSVNFLFNTTKSKSKRSEYYAQHVFEQQFNYLGHNEHLGNATIGIVTILLLVCNVTLLIMKVTVSYCNFASFPCVELPKCHVVVHFRLRHDQSELVIAISISDTYSNVLEEIQ